MIRKRIISILFLSAFLTAAAYAHTAEINMSGGNKYKALRLTPEIYNAADSGLSDLLIKDAQGENVPYFINGGYSESHETREVYPLELINAYLKDDSYYFDYRLAAGRDADTPATSVEFSTAASFAKTVDIYGSYDNIHWEFIQSDKLYSVDNTAKLYIEFGKPEKYTHYRLRLANNLEKISFDSAELIYNTATTGEAYFIESLTPVFSVENKDRETDILIEGLKNLRLRDITISTGSMFRRTVRAQHTEKELYNLSFNGISYTDTTIPLNRQTPQNDIYIVTIINNDDKPVGIDGITVRYYADEVIFEGSGGNYTLEFGADETKTAPVYDIVRYKDEILKDSIDPVTPGAIHYETPEPPPPERDYSLIFNIVVVAVAILLGIVILLRLRKTAY